MAISRGEARSRRRDRVRRRVRGTDDRPRLSVYRSDRHMYVQVITDESRRTILAVSTLGLLRWLSTYSSGFDAQFP